MWPRQSTAECDPSRIRREKKRGGDKYQWHGPQIEATWVDGRRGQGSASERQ
jgi:hypothetical protein